MVRVADLSLSYQVKNTFVEINGVVADGDPRTRLKLSDATLVAAEPLFEAGEASSPGKNLLAPTVQLVPNTPSPFMHPAAVDASLLNCLNSMAFGDMLPPAFGDGCGDMNSGMNMPFDGQDMTSFFNMPMMYDPASGSYWCMTMEPQLPAGHECGTDGMGGGELCGEEHRSDIDPSIMQSPGHQPWCPDNSMVMDISDAPGVWHHENQQGEMTLDMENMQDGQGWVDGSMMDQACMGDGMMDCQHWGIDGDQGAMMEHMHEGQHMHESQTWCGDGALREMEVQVTPNSEQRHERWSDATEGNHDESTQNSGDARGWGESDERTWKAAGAKAAKKERDREKRAAKKEQKAHERAQAWEFEEVAKEQPKEQTSRHEEEQHRKLRDKIENGAAKKSIEDVETGSGSEGAVHSDDAAPGSGSDVPASGNTTVMLRNIPNKYTREMLVKQLNQDFRGRFDFVYLPIDFKNKCNVGYGFINFRNSEACDEFVSKFNGVDVRKCLPGLNSKKVAEVTPARVQGLEENIRRLRNGPVMNELVQHPEWMPLLLTEDGEERPFPVPDAPCPPAKGRHRAAAGRSHREEVERPPRESRDRRSRREW